LEFVIRFGRYSLHPTQGLMLGRREVKVTRKSLAVLRLLAERSGEVVTKDEIFRHVWPDTAVSDSALTSCVQELRQVLGDSAREPRFIETLHRRGFRFLVPASQIESTRAGRVPSSSDAAVRSEPIVGRDRALDAMAAALALADTGSRQLIVVTGEPGIGKTALVEAFLARLSKRDSLWLAHGACVERFGAGEAYQPVLEALTRLCRQRGGERVLAALRRHAPTWLAQLPALQTAAELRTLRRRTAGVTQQRMQRELSDCIEAISSDTTIALWIEDLHWSDVSTLDWLSAFAQRPDIARVLLVATARPGTGHPFDSVNTVFRLKPWCHQIPLSGISSEATLELVTRRLGEGAADVRRSLAARIHSLTEGHPLFITVMLNDLQARSGSPRDRDAPEDARQADDPGVPDNLRALIERQFDELDPTLRTLLDVASVAGPEWSSAAVAAGAGRPQAEVESLLMELTRRNTLIRHAGTSEWPDGTIAGRFSFVHALHCEVLHERLPAGLRAEVHRSIGQRLEAAYSGRTQDLAAELAVHFHEARDIEKTIAYLTRAGQNAARRGAAREARRHLTQALALVEALPSSASRDEKELDLQVALGSVLMAAHGWGAPEVERAYDRARHLSEALAKTPQLFPSVWGMWLFRWGRGDLASAGRLAGTLEELARGASDPLLHLQMHHARWATAFSIGDLDAVRSHADKGLALYCERQHGDDHASIYGNHDAGVCSRLFASRALAMQGRIAEAVGVSDEAVAHARRLDHSFTLALALVFAAAVHHLRGEPHDARDRALEAVAIAGRHGFSLLNAWATALEGWATAELGSPERAASSIEAAVASAFATGSHQFRTLLLGLLAEAHLKSGRAAAGLDVIEQALTVVRNSGERFHEPELHRLRGDLLRLLPDDNPASRTRDAEAALQLAIAKARAQGANLFTLRASVSLDRLLRSVGKADEAHIVLTSAVTGMPEAGPELERLLQTL
jgi:DNA-binding winged helix-turn-helix (wHTH) protein/tetratricopeptide (TPR) repeat protein